LQPRWSDEEAPHLAPGDGDQAAFVVLIPLVSDADDGKYDPRTPELDYLLADPGCAWSVFKEIFYDNVGPLGRTLRIFRWRGWGRRAGLSRGLTGQARAALTAAASPMPDHPEHRKPALPRWKQECRRVPPQLAPRGLSGVRRASVLLTPIRES
jgi:hypothetical protein